MRRPPKRLILSFVVAALVLAGCSSDRPKLVEDAGSTSTTAVASDSCDPRLDPFPNHVAYAKNNGPFTVYTAPGGEPQQTFQNPRQTDTDPPVDVPLLFLATAEPKDNCDWLQVLLPVRPNGTTGWVKRADVNMEGNTYRFEVDLKGFKFTAYEGDKVILETDIGVAKDNTPTPGGVYYTTELLKPPTPDTVYGSYAFGLSGFSEVLSSFNGGQGQLGIHGTNQPEKIGQQVSNGCVRMRNEDIEKLVDELKTPYGIRVEIDQ